MEAYSNQGLTVWLTGLSGSGKSTLSQMLKKYIQQHHKKKVIILDGDKIRKGINDGLGFSQEDRAENIRRVSEISKLLNQQGIVCIVACISPYTQDRNKARRIHQIQKLLFLEIFVSCSLEQCEKRDPKGLYKKVRSGQIKRFTGINDPYEPPVGPQLLIPTHQLSLDGSFQILKDLIDQKYFKKINHLQVQEITKEYICDAQTMNLLQIFLQKWTEVDSFMNYQEILQSVYFKTYSKKGKTFFQPIPLFTLIQSQLAQEINKSKIAKLKFINPINNQLIAVLNNPKVEKYRHEQLSSKIFGIFSPNHPKIGQWLKKGDYILSGTKLIFSGCDIVYKDGLDCYRKDAQTIKKSLQMTKCDAVFAFQLRNPLHNGHLFLLQKTKEQLLKKGFKKPVLLLHPCGGWVKDDDVPLEVRIRQHEALLKESKAFSQDQYILAIWPSPMFYAGPLQVLWHIKSRQMLNIQFMVVGRDPAGVKHPQNSKLDLYDPYDGHRVIEIAKKLNYLKVDVIPFKVISWNKVSQELMEFIEAKKQEFEMISGSQMRTLAKANQQIPQWFMSKRSWQILRDYYNKL